MQWRKGTLCWGREGGVGGRGGCKAHACAESYLSARKQTPEPRRTHCGFLFVGRKVGRDEVGMGERWGV